MKDIRIKAIFDYPNPPIEFDLTDIICNMGSEAAGDISTEEQIGKEMAFLKENWNKAEYILL